MIAVSPNFNFAGRCEEALNLYQKAFHARLGCLLRYSDVNEADLSETPYPHKEDYIEHAEIWIGNQRIMMCDNMDVDFVTSLSLSLIVTFDTKEEVQQAYDVLREGSKIIYPMHSTAYSSCTVTLIDKFGFRWGLMTEQTGP